MRTQQRNTAPTKQLEAISKIAADVLEIESLSAQGRDQLDFHDLHVDTLRRALLAAYNAGRATAQEQK